MRYILSVILFAGIYFQALATAQDCERLVDNGVAKGMCTGILDRDTLIFNRLKERLSHYTTSCWRGYRGHWKIQNDSLFLDSVTVNTVDYRVRRKIEIDDLFSSLRTPSGYFFNSFSDTLRVVSGECIHYVHMAWDSSWENEEIITVNQGIVKGRKVWNNAVVNEGKESAFQNIGSRLFDAMDSVFSDKIGSRFIIHFHYTDFDSDGNPLDCYIKLLRSKSDDETNRIIENLLKEIMLSECWYPVYRINGRYWSDFQIFSVVRRK